MLLIGAQALAQSYKCTAADGKVTLQQSPCPATPRGTAMQPTQQNTTPSLTELTVRCSKLSKETSEYHTCAAQLSCVEAGNQGAVYTDCVAKLTQGRRRADAVAESRAEQARASARTAPTPKSAPVDCTSLYSYARAKGHSWMEAVAIAKEAEDKGTCQKTN
jgi:Domain of unknown function (DUF4124)